MEEARKRSILYGIVERVVSFLAVFAVAFMWVGSTRQKVQQKVSTLEEKQAAWEHDWKTDYLPLITKMNLQGSVATTNFIENYNKEQAQQYVRIDRLEVSVGHLEAMQKAIDRLERKIDDGNSRLEQERKQ